jgi:hypothetical protein
MIDLPVITIKCSDADCENDRHAFNEREYKRLGSGRNFLAVGVCKACGADGVDWERAHRRDVRDIEHLVTSLLQENIRYVFWNRDFNDASIAKAMLQGRAAIFRGIPQELLRTVGHVAEAGWAFKMVPTSDDKMTDVVQYAQHAMAACCRRCIHAWHGISNASPLTADEIAYLSSLVRRYLEARLPPDIPA